MIPTLARRRQPWSGRAGAAVLVAVLALVGPSAACEPGSGGGGSPAARVARDGPPRRVVSTMPSTTEMLHAIGAWDVVVGVSLYCDTPTEARALPGVGSGMQPDLERLLALEPDLVVGTVAQHGYDFVAALEAAGIPVLLVPDRSLEEVYAALKELGRALAREAGAEEVVTRMQAELAELQATIGESAPVRALLVYHHDPIYAAGPHTMVGDLLAAAGGTNVLGAGAWVQLDREQVIHLAPAVILEAGPYSPAELRRAWSPLTTVPAVRDGRIHALSSPGLSRPGPGAPAAAREIAARLYPDRVSIEAP
jgi:iron complex transport system substrate-binding protein